jgi:hypothetical protein
MKKIYVLIIAAMIIASVSCEKDETNQDGLETCILQKTTWSIPNDPAEIITNFTYDGDGNLMEIERKEFDLSSDPFITLYELTYNGNQLQKIKRSFDGTPSNEHIFYYSGDKIDSVHQKSIPSEIPWAESYFLVEYLNNKVSKVVSYNYNFSSGLYTSNSSTELEWTGNNVTRLIYNYSSGQPVIIDYLYDDKKSPLESVGLGFLDYTDFTVLSENNVIKAGDVDVEISYNSLGYPVSIKRNAPYEYPTSYEYSCK